jgi:hypothetical protein
LPRRPTTIIDAREMESTLRRALQKRGLEMEDLDGLGLAAQHSRLRQATAKSDAKLAESSLYALIEGVERGQIGPEVPTRKLLHVKTRLSELKESLPSRVFSELETRYLDLTEELHRAKDPRDQGGVLVRISTLDRDIREAGRRAHP